MSLVSKIYTKEFRKQSHKRDIKHYNPKPKKLWDAADRFIAGAERLRRKQNKKRKKQAKLMRESQAANLSGANPRK